MVPCFVTARRILSIPSRVFGPVLEPSGFIELKDLSAFNVYFSDNENLA